jgi:hypothetical protein
VCGLALYSQPVCFVLVRVHEWDKTLSECYPRAFVSFISVFSQGMMAKVGHLNRFDNMGLSAGKKTF